MMWMISLALAAQIAAPQDTIARPEQVYAYASAGGLQGDRAAAAAQPKDPADSLLRAASGRMSRGDYRAAADMYRTAVQRFPTSMRLSEAMYYEAFALYRAGDLPRARAAIDAMRARYPQQAARGDAGALRTRICGALAREGDSDCAAEVTERSTRVSEARAPRNGGECPDGESEEDDTRIAALNALLQMDAERAMPILTGVLARRDKCSERLRRKAVFLVAQKQTPASANVLLAAARNDPDAEVRQQAVFWLSQVRDPRALDMLVEIVNGDGEVAVRDRALFALSQHSSARAATALRTFAENESEPSSLRERAIFSLGQRSGAEQTEYLRSLYRKLGSQDLRERVLFALSQRRGAGNEAFMMGIANDPKEPFELRKKAIFWAGQMGIDVGQLGRLYGTLDNREIRDQVIFALSQRREPEALSKLMDIAKSEPDRELRKKAIFWLGQSRDPRATAFLAELINK